ncbi:MAG: hypothetical protein JW751_30200 [Polyangiaceae bacterium]|nr:hypothetical protein [Polyangiaceae bacterium]
MIAARWLRRLALGLVLAVLGSAVVTIRVIADGERALAASERAFDAGDVEAATLHARTAAIQYVPGAPHVRAAYERMIAIATGAEAAGDRASALAAWRAVRSAGLETRHLWLPHPEETARANENLARLQALTVEAAPAGSDSLPAERMARLRSEAAARLERDALPRTPWLIVLGLGFVFALSGLGGFVARGLTPDGTLEWTFARWALLLFAIGAACWTMAAVGA